MRVLLTLLSILYYVNQSSAAVSCQTLLRSTEPTNFHFQQSPLHVHASFRIGNFVRKVAIVASKDYDAFRAQNGQFHIEGQMNSRQSPRLTTPIKNTIERLFFSTVYRAIEHFFGNSYMKSPPVTFEHEGDLTAYHIRKISRELETRQIEISDISVVIIGNFRFSGADFRKMANEAEKGEFVSLNVEQGLNRTSRGFTGNVLDLVYSFSTLAAIAGFYIDAFSFESSTLQLGTMLYLQTAMIGSITQEFIEYRGVGKIFYFLPNLSGILAAENQSNLNVSRVPTVVDNIERGVAANPLWRDIVIIVESHHQQELLIQEFSRRYPQN